MPMGKAEAVKRGFVILQEPGKIPEQKGPFTSDKLLERFTREVIACRSAETHIIVVQLTWDDDLWLESGRQWIAQIDALSTITAEEWKDFNRMIGGDA